MNNLATSPFVLLTRVIYVFWFILSASCSTQATSSAGENELSNQKKYFKNIQASILYPEGLQEIESEFSYTFTDNNDYIYIASVYINQNIEQVKQTVVGNLSQNGFIITLENNFASNNKGLTVANASVEYAGNTFPGYLILKTEENNTYLFLGCVTNEQLFSVQKQNLTQMALSLETGTKQNTQTNAQKNPAKQLNSAQEYQHFLSDKALVYSNHSKSTMSGEDRTASHGVVTYYEDVEKTKRFVLCGGGFSYFRFISKGDQMTGDNGLFVLDKFSGHWKVISENNQNYIYIQDERDNRYRTWKIDQIKDNLISIEGNVYTIYSQQQSGNECTEQGLIVPD